VTLRVFLVTRDKIESRASTFCREGRSDSIAELGKGGGMCTLSTVGAHSWGTPSGVAKFEGEGGNRSSGGGKMAPAPGRCHTLESDSREESLEAGG